MIKKRLSGIKKEPKGSKNSKDILLVSKKLSPEKVIPGSTM